jgi:regulator of sigma E protease
MILSVISFCFVLFVVAMAHEGGHFLWAKKAGIRVLELGLGFGPRLFAFKKGDTVYSVNLFPVLAFVRLAGIDEESEDEKNCPEEQRYYSKSAFEKFKAIAAGPAANMALGILIFAFLSNIYGMPQTTAEIASVSKNSAASTIGIKPKDILLSVGGMASKNPLVMVDTIHKSAGKKIKIEIIRNGKIISFLAVPKYDNKLKVGLLGFGLETKYNRSGLLKSFWIGIEKTYEISAGILFVLGQLLIGKLSITGLAGPLGIAQFSGQAASQGFPSLLFFIGLISINLGVFNLLPLPALDGGRLVFIIIEAVRGKPIPIEQENKIHQWGLIALLLLAAVVTVNDLFRILKR